jgi:hypothetical protein
VACGPHAEEALRRSVKPDHGADLRRTLALVFCLVLCTPAAAADSDIKSITYVRWNDIGLPGSMAQLRPAEIAKLRRCDSWSMYFTPAGDGLDQVFVVGMTMQTQFPNVLVSHLDGETIFILFKDASGKTSDTLHLSQDGSVLTQFSPPFRPHTYVRCADAKQK